MPHQFSPCPSGSRSCAYEERSYRFGVDEVFAASCTALQEMGPVSADVNFKEHSIHAVFRVFVFKDDLYLSVQSSESGAELLVKSQSRVGNGDLLGVNQRRVDRFFRHIAKALSS